MDLPSHCACFLVSEEVRCKQNISDRLLPYREKCQKLALFKASSNRALRHLDGVPGSR